MAICGSSSVLCQSGRSEPTASKAQPLPCPPHTRSRPSPMASGSHRFSPTPSFHRYCHRTLPVWGSKLYRSRCPKIASRLAPACSKSSGEALPQASGPVDQTTFPDSLSKAIPAVPAANTTTLSRTSGEPLKNHAGRASSPGSRIRSFRHTTFPLAASRQNASPAWSRAYSRSPAKAGVPRGPMQVSRECPSRSTSMIQPNAAGK